MAIRMKYVYQIFFADYSWGSLKTVNVVAVDLLNSLLEIPSAFKEDNDHRAYNTIFLNDFLINWNEAQKMAIDLGWDGDFKHDPEVFWIPAEIVFGWGFVLKQKNNGMTFVISSMELPWLNCKQSHQINYANDCGSTDSDVEFFQNN